jgi:hypothetical protein
MKNFTQTSFFLAFFTVFWTGFMILWFITATELPPWIIIATGVLCVAFGIWILMKGIQCTRLLKTLPDGGELSDDDKKAAKKWNWIFILNGCVIGVSCALLSTFGLYEYIAPVVLLIVGLHYIPISFLYKTKIQTIVAIPTIIVAVLCIISLTTGTADAYAPGVSSLAGAIGAIILGIWIVKTVGAMIMEEQKQNAI